MGKNLNPDLVVNIAIAGALPQDQQQKELVLSRIKNVVGDALEISARYNNQKYGYSDKEPVIQFLTSPVFMEDNLLGELKQNLFPEAKFIGVNDSQLIEVNSIYGKFSILGKDDNPFVSKAAQMLSWICDQADFAVVLCDEFNPYIMELIKNCKNESVPAVSIFRVADRPMLWAETSSYDEYEKKKLAKYLDSILNVSALSSIREEEEMGDYKLLGSRLYSRYMKKHKATVDVSKPFTKDTMLDEATDIKALSDEAEQTRMKLLGWFYQYDKKAIHYSNKYRASIYLRSIMPLVVSVILAVGFYIETLTSPWKVKFPGTELSVAAIIAALAFFVHALLLLYMYRLGNNKTVKSWHMNFIDNRYIAETLRMAVHFIPFGIPVNYSKQLGPYSKKGKRTKIVLHRLRSLIKATDIPNTEYNKDYSDQCLLYLEELVKDQLDYHENSAKRYSNIVSKLKKFGNAAFYLGFILVLSRGALQIYTTFGIIPNINELNPSFQTIVETFANMLALLLPAWAGYFTSKLTLCNFESLYNNDIEMIDGLIYIQHMINDEKKTIQEEKKKEYISYHDLYYISKEVTALMLGEVSEWYSQIDSKQVTKL